MFFKILTFSNIPLNIFTKNLLNSVFKNHECYPDECFPFEVCRPGLPGCGPEPACRPNTICIPEKCEPEICKPEECNPGEKCNPEL